MNAISSNYNNMSVYWYQNMASNQNSGNRLAWAVNNAGMQATDRVQISPVALALSRVTQSSASDDISSALDDLVADGTITQEQEDAIKTALEEGMSAVSASSTVQNTPLADPLDGLVTEGVITSDQQAAVKAAFESVMGAPPAAQTASTEENDPLALLVEAGTITQDQADAIKSVLQSAGPRQMQGPPPGPLPGGPPPIQGVSDDSEVSSFIDEVLADLVTDGTITDGQEDAINSVIESLFTTTETTETDSDESILDALVTNGTISNDQETAVIKAFEQAIMSYTMSSTNLYW